MNGGGDAKTKNKEITSARTIFNNRAMGHLIAVIPNK